MKREKLKVPRGTARKLRRRDMTIFRAERDKRRELADQSTITYNLSPSHGRAPERNPHLHAVATVTDMRNGSFHVRMYESTKDYPANVPCPLRAEVSHRQIFTTYGAAKEASDRINRIGER